MLPSEPSAHSTVWRYQVSLQYPTTHRSYPEYCRYATYSETTSPSVLPHSTEMLPGMSSDGCLDMHRSVPCIHNHRGTQRPAVHTGSGTQADQLQTAPITFTDDRKMKYIKQQMPTYATLHQASLSSHEPYHWQACFNQYVKFSHGWKTSLQTNKKSMALHRQTIGYSMCHPVTSVYVLQQLYSHTVTVTS